MSILREYILDFSKYIVKPILLEFNAYSDSAHNLVMGTSLQETLLGTYLTQMGEFKGEACGIYQMEKASYFDLLENGIPSAERRHKLQGMYQNFKLNFNTRMENWQYNMIGNTLYATACCRLYYMRFAEPLPDAHDAQGLAAYWKKYWNTESGKGHESEFIYKYKQYLDGVI